MRAARKETGLRSLEREATYALKHTERCWNWPTFCHPRFQKMLEESDPAEGKPDSATIDGLFNPELIVPLIAGFTEPRWARSHLGIVA